MKLYPQKIRLLLLIAITTVVCLYLFKPIYLPRANKLGFICKVCTTPSQNQLIAVRLAGENVVSLATVIAFGGDEVALANGELKINQRVTETIIPKNFNYQTRTNNSEEIFVLIYDPPLENIVDYGRIDQERLIGRVFFLW